MQRIYNEDHSLLVEAPQVEVPSTKSNKTEKVKQREQPEVVERGITPLREETETLNAYKDLVHTVQHEDADDGDNVVFSSDSDAVSSEEEECIVTEYYNEVADYRVEYIPSKEDDYETRLDEQVDSNDE